ncbi:MAG: electron transport complex subunit RsxC [Melioribacter sp.]|uniref:electron transport complex subunit RsxC n=1 Tax=Rosettibacter primus TaxID=3111523 RepID=UPI00247EA2DC|nr:electron transport complex subunit RsxC [Melioribacter sp.]
MLLLNNKKTFKGGIHPRDYKELSENLPLEIMPTPKQVIIPLSQHTGKPARPLIKKGMEIKTGELIAEQNGFISSNIHSSVTGKITKIGEAVYFNGLMRESIFIESYENEEFVKLPPLDSEKVTSEEIIQRVKDAGIVGLGGAAFPTYVKLSPPPDKKIDYIILNGCECEPYLTRDYRLMLERTDDVISGLRLIMKAANVKKGIIGIEDNKIEAINKLEKAVSNFSDITVIALKTKYPQGAEKMLIKAATGREIPPGKLPFDVGCIIQNIGTAVAIHDAVTKGEPQTTAVLTVSGKGINQPKNLIVRVGTPLIDVLNFCGGIKEDAEKIIFGGPMMGFAQYDLSAPITKATSGILVLTEDEAYHFEETNCLRCGKCVEVCPLNLIPTRLVRLVQFKKYEEVKKLGITTCMECGTCTYSCPANIPLVQWIRSGKQKVVIMT